MIRPLTALAGLAVLLASAARAAGPHPVAVEAAAQPFPLGALHCVVLRDAGFAAPNDGKTFGVDVGPAPVAAALARAGAPTDEIRLSVQGLLVESPGRIMLFDTGLGPRANGRLAASLAKAGVSPSQVTDVMITHSHLDHVGGLVTAEGAPAFPKAVIHMAAKEWSWMQAQPGARDVATAIAPQVRTFTPGESVAPGVTAVAIAGHTPGHAGYEIVSGEARLLDLGDTAHSSIVSLAEPDWTIAFDGDAALAKASRRATLTRLAASHERVFAPHFPFPGVGFVEAAGAGFVWRPALPQ